MEPLNRKTRNILIVIYAITFLILAIIYLATRNNTVNNVNLQISPTETPTFTPSPTWTPTPTYPPPIPQVEYKNEKYGYQITYGKGTKVVEHNTDTYGLTSFDNGCYQINSIPVQSIGALSSEKTGVPFSKLEDIKNLPEGEHIYIPEMQTTFTKWANVYEGGYYWYASKVKQDSTSEAESIFSFLYKDDYLYVTFIRTSTSCNNKATYNIDFLNINTVGWKTYSHPKGLYTIQYPPDQEIVEGKMPSTEGSWYSVPDGLDILPMGLSIEYKTKPESLSLSDYMDKNSNCIHNNSQTKKPYVLNGNNGYRYGPSPCGIWPYSEINVLHNNIVYIIQVINDSNVTKKMLSTFRFNN